MRKRSQRQPRWVGRQPQWVGRQPRRVGQQPRWVGRQPRRARETKRSPPGVPRPSRRLVRFVTALLLLTPLPTFAADATTSGSFDAHGLHVAPDLGGLGAPVGMPGAQRFEAGDLFFGGVFEWAGPAPAGLSGLEAPAPVLDDLAAFNFGVGYAPTNRLRVDAVLPVFLASIGPDGTPNPILLGDSHVSATLALRRPDPDSGWGLAFHPWVDLPSGDDARFLGQPGTGGGGLLTTTVLSGHLMATGDLGLVLNPAATPGDGSGQDELELGAAFGWMFMDKAGIVGEVREDLPIQVDASGHRPLSGEALLSARLRGRRGGALIVGGAIGLGSRETAAWRFFLGGGYSGGGPSTTTPSPAPPTSPEATASRATATPPPRTTPIPTASISAAPPSEGPTSERPAATGAAPTVPLPGSPSATPLSGATVAPLPITPRAAITPGDPPTTPDGYADLPVSDGRLTLRGTIYFDGGGVALRPDAIVILDEVARTLLHHPELGRVEIAGHTDSNGAELDNLALSQRRVDIVRGYLIDAGVPPGRLVARGYGEADPMDTNLTTSGRARNRRVEFRILGD